MLGKYIALTVLGVFFSYVIYDFIKGFKIEEQEEWQNKLNFELIKMIEHELRAYRTGAVNTYINTLTGEYKAEVDLIELNKNLQPVEAYRSLCIIAQEKLNNLIDADINIVKNYPYQCICSLDMYGNFTQHYVAERRTV